MEKESVAIGVVEILSDHLKGTVFCVVGACVNDLKRGAASATRRWRPRTAV